MLFDSKVDLEKMIIFFNKIKNACKMEKPLDLLLSFIDNVKMFINPKKIMIVPIDPYLQHVVTSKKLNTKEKFVYLNRLEFMDQHLGYTKNLVSIAKSPEEKCDNLLIESIATREIQEIIVNQNTVSLVIWHNKEDTSQPFFILQYEMGVTAAKSKLANDKSSMGGK